MVEQGRINAELRVRRDLVDPWFANPVPVFEGGFQIPVEEVERGKKVDGVVVVRVKAQSAVQVALGRRVAFLPEGDAGKLYREALVTRILPFAGCERRLRFVPSLEPGKGQAAIVIHVRRCRGAWACSLHDEVPAFVAGKFFKLGWVAAEVLRAGGKRNRQQERHQKGRNGGRQSQCPGAGTASRVQLCMGRHRISKFPRSIFKSFRCAGSFTRMVPSWLSSPATTT